MAQNSAKASRLLFVFAAGLMSMCASHAQKLAPDDLAKSIGTPDASCEALTSRPVREALRPVCLRTHAIDGNLPTRSAIIVGFVGGFAQHDDLKHPEVNFAALLRQSYPTTVHAEVFSNHDGDKALRRVMQLLDKDENGQLTPGEKQQARVIIYGHSWGGSQTVALARALGERGIPVRLTIQLDSVRKPGEEDSTIPANVKEAINFYQSKGLIHGRSTIHAADPETTSILGNVHMTYTDHQINCDNYPWLPRHFNKPHHEIENDPEVWAQVTSLIDSALVN
jgi:hypothetical protein